MTVETGAFVDRSRLAGALSCVDYLRIDPKKEKDVAVANQVQPVPEGYGTLTLYLTVIDGNAAIDFYTKAFGAEEICRMPGPDGKGVMHAELQFGSSRMMMSQECPGPGPGAKAPETLKGTTITVHMYVPDVDASFDRAMAAGATELMKPADMFWGDRMGKVADPFGHHWTIGTHVKDMTPEEIDKAAAKCFAEGPC